MQSQLIAGRYQVLRAIGRGGMGTVWLCRDEVLGREVAVKQVGALPGESATQTKRAMREARSAAALNHPNAVAVYDVVEHDGRPWLVMEYVEGQTLADEISRDGQLSPHRVADIGAQLASALARAHERRIVHRDIKPGNVLIDKAGRPKISDFGIARGHGDEQLTQVGFITGTPGFLSPELARGGDPHPASDVWALGATLYAAVEGQPPYEPRSNPIALLRAIATERPRPMTRAGVLRPAIDAMMHEDPACRWDMATSARRLRAIVRAGTPAYPPRRDPSVTRVIGVPAFESTQSLPPTQRVTPVPPEATQPVAEAPVAARVPEATQPVAKAPVAKAPVAKEPMAKVPVAKVPVAKEPVAAKVPAPARVPEATQPVAKAPAAARPVAELPVPASPRNPQVGAPAATPDHQRRVPRWLPIAVVALLVVLGGGYLLSPLGDQGSTNLAPVTKVTPAQATSAPTGGSEPTVSPSATTPEPSSTTVAPATSSNKKLEAFVTSYYSNVTTDRDTTWAQLTPQMQDAAGGRSGYDGFWRTIRKVRVKHVQADASASSAIVNLIFTRKDGGTSSETHRFTFAGQGESYLIASDSGTG